jgi:hypothetical protein
MEVTINNMAYLKTQSPVKLRAPLKHYVTDDYFYPVTTIDQIIMDDSSKLNNYSIISSQIISSTLSYNNWYEVNGQYVQVLLINGLTEEYNVNIKVAYTGKLNTDRSLVKSASFVSYAKQDNDIITFYCLKNKPIVDIPIEIEVKI